MGKRWLFGIFALLALGCSYTVHPVGDAGTGPATGTGTGTTGGSQVSCSMDTTSCNCVAYSNANNVVCSPVTVTDAVCCATTDWPKSGGCSCVHAGCTLNSGSCTCEIGATGSASVCTNTATDGKGICCQTSFNCFCDNYSTSCSGSTKTSACYTTGLTCSNGEVPVAQCSN
jgi:hypothetical protein